ncbi:hypothetical protein RYB07_26730, partial [Pseudomonas syringae pv. actinidifoliorum]|nr:hypothetical protein [Pseudomonas syringae pv. actinidifoliorum]
TLRNLQNRCIPRPSGRSHSAEFSEPMHAMNALRGNAFLVMKLRIKRHPRIFNRINPTTSEYFFAFIANIRVNIKKFSPPDQ